MIKRSILFFLPHAATKPVGGYKVAYEYANCLAREGYTVKIVYGTAVRYVANPLVRLAYRTIRWFRYLKFRFFVRWTPDWFNIDPQIEQLLRYDFRPKTTPQADCYIATSWSTAPWVAKLVARQPTRTGIYLIQSFESWDVDEQTVIDTWRLPLVRVVIAPWLLDKAQELGVEAHLIENGLDQNYFRLNEPIEERKPHSVAMLYHPAPLKGCADGLRTIEILKGRYADLQATLFGAVGRPAHLPEWIGYIQQPNQAQHNQLYNGAALFLAPSYVEGFALTPPEAMLCGAAVCATDIGGYTVVCRDKETALISPVANPEAMANNASELMDNTSLRVLIAQRALEHIKQYTWERAYGKFSLLLESINPTTHV